jgi:hypothetical protein
MLAVVPQLYFSRDEEILAGQQHSQREEDAQTEVMRRLERRLSALETSTLTADLAKRFELGYALVYTDGRSFTFDDSRKSLLSIDWDNLRFLGFAGPNLLLRIPDVRSRPNAPGGTTDFSDNLVSVPPEVGRGFSMDAGPGVTLRFEIIAVEREGIAAVFGANSRQTGPR